MLSPTFTVVDHGADAAGGHARDDVVANLEGTVLQQHGGQRAARFIQLGFDDDALGHAVGVGLELHGVGLQKDHFQQVVHAVAGDGADGHHDRIAAPGFGHQFVLGQILLDPVGVGAGQVHFVDSHHDGGLSGPGVVDGLDGLGHDAVVGGHHQDGDIRHHGASGAHGRKCLVARGIQESDGASVDHDAIGADVLRNAAGLSGNHVGAADTVEKGGFAVVHMSHDDHDRSAGDQLVGRILPIVDQAVFDCDDHLMLDLASELHSHQCGGVIVYDIRYGGHDAELDQLLDDLNGRFLHTRGKLADVDLIGNGDLDRLFFGYLELKALHFFALFLTALGAARGLLALPVLVLALDLFLALALHVLRVVARHVVEALIIFGEIGPGGTAGVHYALFGDLLGLRRLFFLRLRRRGSSALRRRGRLPGTGRGSFRFLLVHGFLRRGLGLGSLGFNGLGSEDLRNAAHLVVLSQILENDVQLSVFQNLHVVFRRGNVIGQDLTDHFAGHAEILGDLMDPVFEINCHMQPPVISVCGARLCAVPP